MKLKCPIPDAVPRKHPNRSLAAARKLKRCSVDFPLESVPSSSAQRPNSLKLSKAPSLVVKADSPLNMQKLSKIRAVTHAPQSLPLPEIDYEFVVLLLSTWGQSECITCSEIDFLTEDRIPIPDVRASFTNKNEIEKQYINDLQSICNRTLVKTPRHCWSYNWDFKNGPVSLCFSFTSTKAPEYIRIWNGKLDTDSQLKGFRVYFNKKRLYEGEVPCQFGIVAHIKLSDDLKMSIFNFAKLFDDDTLYDTDKYGRILVHPAKQIAIKLIDTFTPGSKDVGLNSIQFFCSKEGKEISFSSIKTIKVTGATSVYSPFHLLKDRKRTMDEKDMWIAHRDNPNDKIWYVVTFNKPIPIILVRIWNYNGSDVDIGVKKALITVDDNIVWSGCLNKAKGMTSKIVEGVTDIWLSEMEKWKDVPAIATIQTTRVDDVDDNQLASLPTLSSSNNS